MSYITVVLQMAPKKKPSARYIHGILRAAHTTQTPTAPSMISMLCYMFLLYFYTLMYLINIIM